MCDSYGEEDGWHDTQTASPVGMRYLGDEDSHAGVGGADGQGGDEAGEEDDRQ